MTRRRLLALGLVLIPLFLVGFKLRSAYLFSEPRDAGSRVPDLRAQGYAADDLQLLLSTFDQSQKNLYVWTQLSLDMIFPLVYGAVLGAFVTNLLSGWRRTILLAIVSAVVLLDWTENALLATIFSTGNLDSTLVAAASWATRAKWWLLLVTTIILASAAVYRYGRWIGERFRMRYPALALAVLAGWTTAACGIPAFRPLFANLLLLEDCRQIAFLAATNTLAIIFSIAIWRLLRHRVARTSNPHYQTAAWNTRLFAIAVGLGLISPLVAFAFSYAHAIPLEEMRATASEFPIAIRYGGVMDMLLAAGLAAAGCAIALLLMFCLGRLRSWILGATPAGESFFPFEDTQRRRQRPSWLMASASDLELVFYLLALLVIFFGWLRPVQAQFSLTILSIPAYIVLMIWMTTLVLAGLSAWLDKSRIPVLLVIVLWIVGVRTLTSYQAKLPVARLTQPVSASTQALLDLLEAETRLEANLLREQDSVELEQAVVATQQRMEDNAWQAIASRMSRLDSIAPDRDRTLVIVTCPGGGIHAAAWSAYVLEQLDKRYVDFFGSVCVISGVSGGAVGSMFYVNHRRSVADPSKPLVEEPWRQAVEASLGPIGAGLAFQDAPSMLLPIPKQSDRGVRLEEAWKARLGGDAEGQTLEHWGRLAMQGRLPVVVCNATDAASGRRVLCGTIPTPRRTSLNRRSGRPWDIRELFNCAAYEMHVATAARASASFPYVSPFTIPEHATSIGKGVALSDGGYADNAGIVSAIDWLDFIARRAAEEFDRSESPPPFRRILLLRIQPVSDAEPPGGAAAAPTLLSYVRWLFGPLEALASMRTSSQLERGQLEVDLAAGVIETPWWKRQPQSGVPSPPVESNALAGMLPADRAQMSNVRQRQADIFQRETTAQRKLMMEQAGPLGGMGETAPSDAIAESTQPESTSNDDTESSQSRGAAQPDWLDYPVLITTLPFVAVEPEQAIPLNWKLSERQKLWYPAAWKLLEKTSQGERENFFKELDVLFVRRSQTASATVPTQ